MRSIRSMASHNLDNLTTNLCRLQIRGAIVKGDQIGLVGNQIEVKIDTAGVEKVVAISLHCYCTFTYTYTTKFSMVANTFYFFFIGSIEVGHWMVGWTKHQSVGTMAYWIIARGWWLQRCLGMKALWLGYIFPKASSRGFVSFKDFVVERYYSGEESRDKIVGEWIWRSKCLHYDYFLWHYWVL